MNSTENEKLKSVYVLLKLVFCIVPIVVEEPHNIAGRKFAGMKV